MGPVEKAVRATYAAGARLQTVGQSKPFQIERLDHEGMVLLLAMKWPTRLSWECLEGVVGFLRGRGWVRSGGVHSIHSEPGSLDQYLKQFVYRDTTNWVAVVLAGAGVLELDPGRPLRVRLARSFSSAAPVGEVVL